MNSKKLISVFVAILCAAVCCEAAPDLTALRKRFAGLATTNERVAFAFELMSNGTAGPPGRIADVLAIFPADRVDTVQDAKVGRTDVWLGPKVVGRGVNGDEFAQEPPSWELRLTFSVQTGQILSAELIAPDIGK